MQNIDKPWHKKWWAIILFIIATLILILVIASGFYIADEVKRIKSSAINQTLFTPSPYQGEGLAPLDNFISNGVKGEVIEGENNYWMGAGKPRITIVEFADFSCPLCKNSFTKIREISLKYKKNVKIIFRDYPMYEHSLNLAMAARCAGEQGLFWLMHDKLFQNQNITEKSQLSELSNQIGANVNKFNNCLTNKKYLKQIQKDFADAEKLEVTGTPTWFINGQKIAGDIPYGLWIEIVEKLIQKNK